MSGVLPVAAILEPGTPHCPTPTDNRKNSHCTAVFSDSSAVTTADNGLGNARQGLKVLPVTIRERLLSIELAPRTGRILFRLALRTVQSPGDMQQMFAEY